MRTKSAVRLGILCAVMGGLALTMVAPAGAVTKTVKLTPASNDKVGTKVTITYAGFSHNEQLYVLECNADASIAQDGSGCNLTKGFVMTTSNSTGGGTVQMTLATSPVGSNSKSTCPLSAADYKAGVHCVIAVASPANHADNAAANLYFAPAKPTATAVPVHSGTSKITVKGTGWETHGLPANCTPATGAPAPGSTFIKCTSVVGEVVTVMVNGVKVGTATAQPGASGAILFTGNVTLKKGTNTITLTGGTSHETATTTIVTSA